MFLFNAWISFTYQCLTHCTCPVNIKQASEPMNEWMERIPVWLESIVPKHGCILESLTSSLFLFVIFLQEPLYFPLSFYILLKLIIAHYNNQNNLEESKEKLSPSPWISPPMMDMLLMSHPGFFYSFYLNKLKYTSNLLAYDKEGHMINISWKFAFHIMYCRHPSKLILVCANLPHSFY